MQHGQIKMSFAFFMKFLLIREIIGEWKYYNNRRDLSAFGL